MTKYVILPALLAAGLTLTLGLTSTTLAAEPMRAAASQVQIAHYNNLNKFRRLKPGSRIVVPPIIPPRRADMVESNIKSPGVYIDAMEHPAPGMPRR